MSLFGGDSPLPPDPNSSGSEFSISAISSPESQAVQDAQTEHDESAETANGSPLPLDIPDGHSVQREEEVDSAELNARNEPWNEGRERYQGSDSMYRYQTRRERALISSMEQLRSDDLSLHLYNAHAWKARLRSQDVFAAKGPFRKKNAWIPGGRGQDQKEWYPDQAWTSWPLEPSLVPRPGEDFGQASESRKELERDLSTNAWKPREELQEDVVGLLLKHANEQWTSRPESTIQKPKRGASSDDAEDADVDADIAPKSEEDEEEHLVNSSVPVMSADEDRLRTILRPTTNHILSRLDDLLMALHHNRNGHYKTGQDSDADDSRPSSLSRSRSRGSKRRTVRKQAQEDDDDDTESDEDDDKNRATSSDSRSRSRKRHKTMQSLPSKSTRGRSGSVASSEGSDYGPYHRGPRDWSEVLGVAMLVGWDEAAVQRTLLRCADLFGEDMQLSTVDNGRIKSQSEPLDSALDDTREVAIDTAEEALSPEALQAPTNGFQYVCPFIECPHHTLPYPSSKGFRFREHLRRAHKFSAGKIKEVEAEILGSTTAAASTPSITSTKRNPRGWVAPEPLLCPFLGCRRRTQGTPPFPTSRRLVEHLIRTHHWDPRKQPPPPILQPLGDKASTEPLTGRVSSEIFDTQSDDEIIGGVHNDGFMEPLDIRIGRSG
ncbi:hypothetical protein MBLNU457_4580t1 [Dothideomycetes sp. NU457]